MGGHNSCDIAQYVYESVLRSRQCMRPEEVIQWGSPLPEGSPAEGTYIDDHMDFQNSDGKRENSIDSVDGRPSFETYLESGGRCVQASGVSASPLPPDHYCKLARNLAETRVRPALIKVATEWNRLGVLAGDMQIATEALFLCSSFVRRYEKMERRD